MQKKLTISLNKDVYDELCRVVGRGNISKFIENPIAPHLKDSNLDDACYRQCPGARGAGMGERYFSSVTFV